MTTEQFEQAREILNEIDDISLLEEIIRYVGNSWGNDEFKQASDYKIKIINCGKNNREDIYVIDRKIPTFNNQLVKDLINCVQKYKDGLYKQFETL